MAKPIWALLAACASVDAQTNAGVITGTVFDSSQAVINDNVGKLRPNIVPGVDPILPGWHEGCNNAVTQTCPYVNSLAVFSPPSLVRWAQLRG